jgi:hypothetical protein
MRMHLVVPKFGQCQVEEEGDGQEEEADEAADGVGRPKLLVKGVQVSQSGAAAARRR